MSNLFVVGVKGSGFFFQVMLEGFSVNLSKSHQSLVKRVGFIPLSVEVHKKSTVYEVQKK